MSDAAFQEPEYV